MAMKQIQIKFRITLSLTRNKLEQEFCKTDQLDIINKAERLINTSRSEPFKN
jgi:hypothetical protein